MQKMFLTLSLFLPWTTTMVLGADVAPWKEKLAASQKAWESARQSCKGNYQYDVTVEFYSGTAHVTTVVVRDNKVQERRFVKGNVARGKPPGTKLLNAVTEWTETTAELGKHEGPAAPSKTVDELYADAKKLLDGPIAGYERLTVSFDKVGLLRECFTIDARLADDNPRKGVAISDLVLGKE